MTEDQRNSLYQGMTYHGFDKIEISDTEVRCHCTIETYEISLICRLSDCFPFELPSVFISEESYNYIAPLPHVNSDLSICTFDRTICISYVQCKSSWILFAKHGPQFIKASLKKIVRISLAK